MKVAIIAVAKNENLYINEWIDYHLNLGFDKIIVGDNDTELVLPTIVKDDNVIIEDYTNMNPVQGKVYTELYEKYKGEYDWFLFIDIDEFLVLEKHKDVKEFLASFPEDVEAIRLNWKHFTDNNELDVKDGDYGVFNRFKTEAVTDLNHTTKQFMSTKVQLNGRTIHCHGLFDKRMKIVNALGNMANDKEYVTDDIVHEIAWLNHYRTKTIGEYMRQKYLRGSATGLKTRHYNWFFYFFQTNEETRDKVKYALNIEKQLEKERKHFLSNYLIISNRHG